MTAYVSKVRKEENITRCAVAAPVFAIYKKIENAGTIDELKQIVREAEPVNTLAPKAFGILRTTIGTIGGYSEITGIVNAITFDGDNAIASMDCEVIGEDSRAYYVDCSGEVRKLYKATTYFFIGE